MLAIFAFTMLFHEMNVGRVHWNFALPDFLIVLVSRAGLIPMPVVEAAIVMIG